MYAKFFQARQLPDHPGVVTGRLPDHVPFYHQVLDISLQFQASQANRHPPHGARIHPM